MPRRQHDARVGLAEPEAARGVVIARGARARSTETGSPPQSSTSARAPQHVDAQRRLARGSAPGGLDVQARGCELAITRQGSASAWWASIRLWRGTAHGPRIRRVLGRESRAVAGSIASTAACAV